MTNNKHSGQQVPLSLETMLAAHNSKVAKLVSAHTLIMLISVKQGLGVI